MAGDGYCLPNSILLHIGFDDDPDGKVWYNQMYMRRQAVRHLLEDWNKLGEQITKDIIMQHGRPDNEINGRLIAKEKRKGKEVKLSRYMDSSVLEWCPMCAERRVLVR